MVRGQRKLRDDDEGKKTEVGWRWDKVCGDIRWCDNLHAHSQSLGDSMHADNHSLGDSLHADSQSLADSLLADSQSLDDSLHADKWA